MHNNNLKYKNIKSNLINKARNLLENKQYYEAEKILIHLHNIFPNDNNVIYLLSDSLLLNHKFIQSEFVVNSINPKNEQEFKNKINKLNIIKSKSNENIQLKISSNNPGFEFSKEFYIKKAKEFENFNLKFKTKIIIDKIFINYKDQSLNNESVRNYLSIKIQSEKIENESELKYTYSLNLNILQVDKICYLEPINNNIIEICTIVSEMVLCVLFGKHNWLFLDNDTNQSVSQFIGKKLISQSELSKWEYFISYLAQKENACLIIPPSKEQVKQEYYPYKRGKICPIDQLNTLIINKQPKVKFIYPISRLKLPNSYSKTDTHWAADIALEIFLEVICNLTGKKSVNIFNFDRNLINFLRTDLAGDLGSKVDPPLQSSSTVIRNEVFGEFTWLNFLNRQGSVVKYKNPFGIIDKKLLVFGDSFSEVIVPALNYIFTDFIIVRSNATVIDEIIEYEKPHFIITEIAERFVIRAPTIVKKLSDYELSLRTDLDPKSILELKQRRVSLECKNSIYEKHTKLHQALLQGIN